MRAVGATPMQYRWPVSDCSCHDGAVRTSATLMTRPHAAFAQPGIVGVRIGCCGGSGTCLSYARLHASHGATPMQYRWPVSDCSCPDGAARTSATLMTRPHAVFARPGILGVRIGCCVWLQYPPVGRTVYTHASCGAAPMQYSWPVSDCSCRDGAVRTSATLMTQPHAAFTHHSILG